jgi:hypothetical protein
MEASQANAPSIEFGHDVDEMSQRTTETVESPHDQGVARPKVVEGVRQLAALIEGATGSVDEGPIAADGSKLVELELGILVDG